MENLGVTTPLKFTPLEFETSFVLNDKEIHSELKFTPLEFETSLMKLFALSSAVKIYSVGV